MRKTAFVVALLIVLGYMSAFPSLSKADTEKILQSATAKLDRWEGEEAWTEVKGLLDQGTTDPKVLDLASKIAFHRGDYQEAARLMKSAVGAGGESDERKAYLLFYEETIEATGSLKRHESPHFVIGLDEKQDGILSDYLVDAMEKTYRQMAREFGFEPREKIRIEIFPDAKAFHYASTLSPRDIEVTGAVGIAKFNKLMLLSPRSLVHGYRWLDAISHEYMHYLILKMTGNKAPIWFHEGLAKYEETKWRNGPSYLSAVNESLLAKALADNKLIAFEKMEPSLIRLETPDDVQLAYAQAASAIEFILEKTGPGGLQEIMKKMTLSEREGAGEAIRAVLGVEFAEFERNWKDYLSTKNLKVVQGVHAKQYKIKEGKADEERLDMAEIKSMVARNKAHLGDLLKERGRTGAAILEYRRALADSGDSVPIMTRLSSALIDTGRYEEALEHLKRARDLAPDHPNIHANLGQTYLKLKEFGKAKEAFIDSIEINPFNPEVHRGLTKVYETLGDPGAAAKEREITKRLGG